MGRGGRRRHGGQGPWHEEPGGTGVLVPPGPTGNLKVIPRLVVVSRVAMVANPGPASYAVVVLDAGSGEETEVASAAIGESTSNAAEYRGLIAGLTAAARLGPGEPAEARLTSELVILQMTGGRQVRSPSLRSLRDQAVRVAAAFPAVIFTKASTDETARVHQLAVEALGTDLHDARAPAAPGTAPARDQAAKAPTGTTDPPRLGAARCAELLSELTGLSVHASHVEKLAAAGLTSIAGHYKKRPLYDAAALRALATDRRHRDALAEIIRNAH